MWICLTKPTFSGLICLIKPTFTGWKAPVWHFRWLYVYVYTTLWNCNSGKERVNVSVCVCVCVCVSVSLVVMCVMNETTPRNIPGTCYLVKIKLSCLTHAGAHMLSFSLSFSFSVSLSLTHTSFIQVLFGYYMIFLCVQSFFFYPTFCLFLSMSVLQFSVSFCNKSVPWNGLFLT